MLKSIKIVNFQSHQNTVLHFGSGVNVIVGTSQHGKSAIVKALKWIVENRAPAGKNKAGNPKFIYRKAKPLLALVEVKTDNQVVTLSRGKGSAVYTVDGNDYKGFGTSIPDEVAKALNFGCLNIQYQLELPFLLTESPGQVAKMINGITRLGESDIWQSSLTTEINQINSQIVSHEQVLNSANNRIEKYKEAGSVELSKKVKYIKAVGHEMVILTAEISSILNLVDVCDTAEEEGRKLIKAISELESVVEYLAEIEQKEQVQNELYEHFELVDAVGVLGKVQELDDVSESIKEIDDRLEALRVELTNIVLYKVLQKEVRDISKDFEYSLKGYARALKETKICPFCGGKITAKAIKEAVEAMR